MQLLMRREVVLPVYAGFEFNTEVIQQCVELAKSLLDTGENAIKVFYEGSYV